MAICILYFWYVHLHPCMHLKLINNGNKTKWSPLWSFIIGVINKIGQPQSRGQICLSQVWLQTGLDDTKSCYQLIIKLIWQNLRKKIDIFDRFSGKKKATFLVTQQNMGQQHANMTYSVHWHTHDMLTVPLTVVLHGPITSMTRTCISAQIRLVICYSFD